MRRVLITGASGFLGEALIPILSDFELHLLVRDESKKALFPGTNVLTIEEISDDVEYDAVVHLAAYISSARDANTAEQLVRTNIEFPSKLLSLVNIKKNGVFIDTGTFAEKWYGKKFGVSYLYADTKKAFKNIASYFCKVKEVNYVRVLPYTIVSEYRQKGKILDLLLNSLDSSEMIPITNGEQVLDFIHRDDVASLYKMILDMKDYKVLDQRSIDCCSGIGRSIRNVASMIETISGKKCNLYWGGLPYREQDIMYAVGDVSDAFNLINWKAKISLEETIRENIKNGVFRK